MRINKNVYKVLIRIFIVIIALVALGTAVFLGLQISGRNRLYNMFKGQAPDLSQAVGVVEGLDPEDYAGPDASDDNWQEGDVRYKGAIYRYNEDILTFLFLGIDDKGEVEVKEEGIEGGQSDAIFLLVLNPHNKEVSVIGVNRDTMTDIDVYNKWGDYMGTTKGQITLQHGYGDGAKISCERSREVVSRLFYGLPIHGYCSINMGGIPLINDTVGGVEVTVLEDIWNFKEGEVTLLKGDAAYHYLHDRDITSFNSAGRRLERQKQYLTAYAATAVEAMKGDITLPVKLYNTLTKYMVTDITVDEVSYLSTRVPDYSFSSERIYSLEGETVKGERFEEFYVDEAALFELILKVFYEEVTSQNN